MERLDKVLSSLGNWSRREVKELVRQGRVSVNDVCAASADMKIDPATAQLVVDGQPVSYEQFTYLMLHKPAGVLSAVEDRRQKTVLDLLPEPLRRRGLSPVGRLDKDTEGLLILTNDGDLANRLLHPAGEVDKVYEVCMSGVTDRGLRELQKPMDIDGYRIRPAGVRLLDRDGAWARLEITIHEGRNRQIRKMAETCGMRVTRLKRIAEGPILLGDLPRGQWRYLTEEEVRTLKNL